MASLIIKMVKNKNTSVRGGGKFLAKVVINTKLSDVNELKASISNFKSVHYNSDSCDALGR